MPQKQDQHATPGQKLLGLYTLLLFTGRKYTLSRLAEIFSCSKQTIARLIGEIERSHNVEVEHSQEGREKCYRIRAPKSRPHVSLSQEQIRQLVLCRDMALHLLPGSMKESLDEAIRKTTMLLPDLEERGDALDSVVKVAVKGGIDYSPFQDHLSTLLDSMRSRSVCAIAYKAAGRQEPREHHMAPMRILSYRESLYVQGWKVTETGAVEVKAPMTLAVHRIEGIDCTRRTFDLPEPNMPSAGIFGIITREPFTVVARFSPTVAQYVGERTWSSDQEIHSLEDGSLELRFTAHSEGEVVSWILGFGSNAELLSPVHLREKVAEEAQATFNKHIS